MVGSIHIMGIVNLTEDSFYAASRTALRDVCTRVASLLEQGADVIDLGACSTRPGAWQPGPEEEWARLEPALKALKQDFPSLQISVDTYRASVAERCFDAVGPYLVNDISAGTLDQDMLPLVGRLGLPYVAMHMRGTPQTMAGLTDYPTDITSAVLSFFEEFGHQAAQYGIRDWILDPGFGFAKTLDQNYELLRDMHRLQALGRPILAGVSRKSMIYKLLGITPEEALPGTQVVHLAALQQGATWLRVHDVAAAVQTARIFNKLES